MSQAMPGMASAAPMREPEKLMPFTRPRSFTGIHEYTTRAMPGNAPASPAPNRKRMTSRLTKFHAAAVSPVNTDHAVTTAVSTKRPPRRSAIAPPGV